MVATCPAGVVARSVAQQAVLEYLAAFHHKAGSLACHVAPKGGIQGIVVLGITQRLWHNQHCLAERVPAAKLKRSRTISR